MKYCTPPKDPLRLRLLSLVCAIIGVLFLLPVFSQAAEWTKYDRIMPEVVHCASEVDAINQAYRYFYSTPGAKYVQGGTGFSMSRLWPTGTYCVIEELPYEKAGGYVCTFACPIGGPDVRHFFVARDKAGFYVSMGYSPTNPHRDPWQVRPEHYKGVVRKAFAWKK